MLSRPTTLALLALGASLAACSRAASPETTMTPVSPTGSTPPPPASSSPRAGASVAPPPAVPSVPPGATPAASSGASIGTATMKPDGTIEMMLRAEGPGGMVGDAMFIYPPSHSKYAATLEHLGGLKPGQSKAVPPWK